MQENEAPIAPDWAKTSGAVWARRWRDTDAGLEDLSAPLLSAVVEFAPEGPFKAFEIGCGPGSTTIAIADACPEAEILACDISPALAAVSRQRTAECTRIRVAVGDAEALAASEGPFDLFFSRHGVMFFPDPVRAFQVLRSAASPGASLVFSCFRSWDSNPWAAELASAAAGKTLPPPGREPSGFAFADPDYVRQIFGASGWTAAEARAVDFLYVAGEGDDAVGKAMSFLTDIGPASRVLQSLTEPDAEAGLTRMRAILEDHFDGARVTFPAAAWIWSAKAG